MWHRAVCAFYSWREHTLRHPDGPAGAAQGWRGPRWRAAVQSLTAASEVSEFSDVWAKTHPRKKGVRSGDSVLTRWCEDVPDMVLDRAA